MSWPARSWRARSGAPPGVRRLLPRGRNSSCALGAAYEGIYRLPDTADGVRPQRLDRLFECLEGVVRTCPECSKKKLPLGALIVHVNDAHHWTCERIAAWVADPDVPQDESHAHH